VIILPSDGTYSLPQCSKSGDNCQKTRPSYSYGGIFKIVRIISTGLRKVIIKADCSARERVYGSETGATGH
jgi:hypothetical protein